MSACEVTADEFFETLTGFDEIAISQRFGSEVTDLAEKAPMRFMRALVFVSLTRDEPGAPPKDSYMRAMNMPVSEVSAFFAESEDEPMPEEPVTAEGKGDAPEA